MLQTITGTYWHLEYSDNCLPNNPSIKGEARANQI